MMQSMALWVKPIPKSFLLFIELGPPKSPQGGLSKDNSELRVWGLELIIPGLN